MKKVRKAPGLEAHYNGGILSNSDGPAIVRLGGVKEWWLHGERHRAGGPAIIQPNGAEEWWFNGLQHREDGPAVWHPDGREEWWFHGKHHRVGGPAMMWPDGSEEWWLDGLRHREDGPAVITGEGGEEWFLHGKHHRVGGPAVTKPDGTKQWLVHGERHRDDGPSIIKADGTQHWFRHGERHRVDGPAVNVNHHCWYIEGHLVDITCLEPEKLRQFTKAEQGRLQRVVDGERGVKIRNASTQGDHWEPSPDLPDSLALFSHYKSNCTVDTLHDVNPYVAAIAAWHLPVDDDYINALFESPSITRIAVHRPDFPQHVATLIEVSV